MKKLLTLLSLGLILLCFSCSSGGGAKPSVDDFDQAAWEVGVTESQSYANFTVGTWWYRKVHETPEGDKDYETGEINVTLDIIDSDYDWDNSCTKKEYMENFNFTKIIEFDDAGYYYEYSKADLDKENSSEFKLYMLNRSSGGTIDKTQKKWSESRVVTANSEKTKYKTYSEEWAVLLHSDEFGIYKTTYFFEKIK